MYHIFFILHSPLLWYKEDSSGLACAPRTLAALGLLQNSTGSVHEKRGQKRPLITQINHAVGYQDTSEVLVDMGNSG